MWCSYTPGSRGELAFYPTHAPPQPQTGDWLSLSQHGEETSLTSSLWEGREGAQDSYRLSWGEGAHCRHGNGGERSPWDVLVVCRLLSQRGKCGGEKEPCPGAERKRHGVRVAVLGGGRCRGDNNSSTPSPPLQPHCRRKEVSYQGGTCTSL